MHEKFNLSSFDVVELKRPRGRPFLCRCLELDFIITGIKLTSFSHQLSSRPRQTILLRPFLIKLTHLFCKSARVVVLITKFCSLLSLKLTANVHWSLLFMHSLKVFVIADPCKETKTLKPIKLSDKFLFTHE